MAKIEASRFKIGAYGSEVGRSWAEIWASRPIIGGSKAKIWGITRVKIRVGTIPSHFENPVPIPSRPVPSRGINGTGRDSTLCQG